MYSKVLRRVVALPCGRRLPATSLRLGFACLSLACLCPSDNDIDDKNNEIVKAASAINNTRLII
jgi:hypothetical protein